MSAKVNEPQDSKVSHLSHQLWEEAGRPSGRDVEFWTEAELRVRAAAIHSPADAMAFIATVVASQAQNPNHAITPLDSGGPIHFPNGWTLESKPSGEDLPKVVRFGGGNEFSIDPRFNEAAEKAARLGADCLGEPPAGNPVYRTVDYVPQPGTVPADALPNEAPKCDPRLQAAWGSRTRSTIRALYARLFGG